jgi:hypothetical protein
MRPCSATCAAKNGLVAGKQSRRYAAYERERKLVDLIVDKIVEGTAGDRESALNILLEAYVTGDHTRINDALGEEAWDQVLNTSRPAQIYVYMPDGSIDVWRPVEAELVGDGVYRQPKNAGAPNPRRAVY